MRSSERMQEDKILARQDAEGRRKAAPVTLAVLQIKTERLIIRRYRHYLLSAPSLDGISAMRRRSNPRELAYLVYGSCSVHCGRCMSAFAADTQGIWKRGLRTGPRSPARGVCSVSLGLGFACGTRDPNIFHVAVAQRSVTSNQMVRRGPPT